MAQNSVQTSGIMFTDDASDTSNSIGVASAVDSSHGDIYEVKF